MIDQSYISTGDKILHHPDAIRDLRAGRPHPILLHVMPTERCNLHCDFCSLAQRGKEELDISAIRAVVSALAPFGLKAAIFSGGGEPLLYPQIASAIWTCRDAGLELGLITNGTRLFAHASLLPAFKWIRISMNSLDYVRDIRIPMLPRSTTLGFSYVWNGRHEQKTLDAIRGKALQHGAAYIRLLPDCMLAGEPFEKTLSEIEGFVGAAGFPFFAQQKRLRPAKRCLLGYVHPVLYADGFIYPCDSLMHNSPEDRRFHRHYALCHWSEAARFYSSPMDGDLVHVSKCPRCAFVSNNDLLASIIEGGNDLPTPTALEHVNFV